MKKILFFIAIITSLNSFSQKDPNIYDFFGGKSFGNETKFFRLIFQIENGKVTGYMFTDEQGSSETKSIINGVFNPKTKQIFFTETKKLISKSNFSFEQMCYLSGNISLDLNKNISKLKGSFIESTSTNKLCRKGTINLISPDAFIKLKKEIVKTESIKPKTIIKDKKVIVPTFDTDKKTVIKDDEEVVIYWTSEKINISIWDDMKEDGDKITIKFNEEIILDNYELKNKHKDIEIELTEKENSLTFTADNTGSLANNTARVDLFDNDIKHQIITQLQLNKSVTVIIKK